ncbi:GntR family transcriptional regulator [Spirillospora sp. NPDC048911]|uniref:GntR family transcriptional regulator n=1 Tax=Spirillospora sp. NPDC048911 TaxID=3364527 RepID=UPI003724AEE4
MQRRIDPNAERPWYRQLADILRGTITSGEWQPGQNLPSEADLVHQYEVSSATVRKALAILRAEGLVESVRGMPWRVRERGEPSVIQLQPGDRVRARLATREDTERYEIPEGVVVLAVSREGGRDHVYRADEVEGVVSDPDDD